MQQQPILTIAFTAEADAAFDPASAHLQLHRHDDALLNDVDWPLATLAARGYDGACLMLGNATLRLLQRAHPAVFATHSGLTPPRPVVTNTEVLVLELIARGRLEETSCYVTALDHLMARLAVEPVRSSLITQWPSTRAEMLANPG